MYAGAVEAVPGTGSESTPVRVPSATPGVAARSTPGVFASASGTGSSNCSRPVVGCVQRSRGRRAPSCGSGLGTTGTGTATGLGVG
jgi:hypothetical protein